VVCCAVLLAAGAALSLRSSPSSWATCARQQQQQQQVQNSADKSEIHGAGVPLVVSLAYQQSAAQQVFLMVRELVAVCTMHHTLVSKGHSCSI
jgi:hypothetical protein